MADNIVSPEVQDWTPDSIRGFLGQASQALHAQAAPWQDELASLPPRAMDFDLSGSNDSGFLGRVKWFAAMLGIGRAKRDEVRAVQAGLSALVAPLRAVSESRKEKGDAAPEGANRTNDSLERIVGGMRTLSDLAAQGAADVDPHSARRTLDRMRNFGDATMRQIEDRLRASDSREDRKDLQILRDELRVWLAARNARVQERQPLVVELNICADTLHKEGVAQSTRWARAAEMTSRAAGMGGRDASASFGPGLPEAEEFCEGLRALLLRARMDITLPLQELEDSTQ